jgi:molybdate transport system regulatory protein
VSECGASLDVRLRIDFGPRSSIGPGKIALLERIEATGSLSQAARELRMSYRRAWLLLDDLNHALAKPVTTTSVGGAGGGGARLTPFGRELIAAYREVEHVSHDAAAARLAGLAAAKATSGRAARETASAGAVSTIERRPISRSLPHRSRGTAPAQSAPRSTPTARGRAQGRRARTGRRASPTPGSGGRRGG